MRKTILIILISQILFSCTSLKCWLTKKCFDDRLKDTNFSQEINLSEYETYVFKLCQTENHDLDNYKSPEELAYPKFGNCSSENSKIMEETYLLMPKDSSNDVAIYITTLSHKYLFDDCGVFNCPEFKNKMFIEDVDKIYLGNIKKNGIEFYSNDQKDTQYPSSIWTFTKGKDSFIIDEVTLYESKFQNKPQIKIESVFSYSVEFNLEDRNLIYGKGAEKYRNKCYVNCSTKLPPPSSPKYNNVGSTVDKLKIGRNNFYFISHNDGEAEGYRFGISRMPFRNKLNKTSK